MATKRTAKPKAPPPKLTLSWSDDETLNANYIHHCYRFLFSDGSMVNVIAVRDDSDLRGAVLEITGKERIAGVAQLDPDE